MIRRSICFFMLGISPAWVQAEPYAGTFIGGTNYSGQAYAADSFELSAGYRFNDLLAAEFSWLSLEGGQGREARRNNNYFNVEGNGLSVLIFVPFTRNAEFFGKFGVYSWNIDLGAHLMTGAGLVWRLSDNLAMRTQYQHVDIQNENVTNLSLGLSVSF